MRLCIRFILPLLVILFAPVAAGAVFRVGSDANCTHATLAAALAAAVANGAGHDEIRLRTDAAQTNVAYSITGTDVTIAGGYATCDSVSPDATGQTALFGNAQNSVVTIGNARRVNLRRLSIVNGGNLGVVQGDFITGGGVNLVSGVAELYSVTAVSNHARFGGGLAVSGSGSVMVVHGDALGSRIRANRATLGGGIYVGPGATLRLENDGVAVADNIANGSATANENSGGGIYATGSPSAQSSIEATWLEADPDLPMPAPRGLIVAGNTSNGYGGGMSLIGNAQFIGHEVTIRDNAAAINGGGVWIYGGGYAGLVRRPSVYPAWLPLCEGRYGCNRLTGNVAARGGGIMVMHGRIDLGQILIADNRSTDGGGAAIHTGSIAGVPNPVNRILLESAVLVRNQCSGTPSTNAICATMNTGAGPNQVDVQHATFADNVLGPTISANRAEIYTGPSSLPVRLRSSIIEPALSVSAVWANGPLEADCVMSSQTVGNRPLVRPIPYAFVSRTTDDYRPIDGDVAIDGCDGTQLLPELPTTPDMRIHGSVDHPGVVNRLGAASTFDIGAFETTPMLRDGFE